MSMRPRVEEVSDSDSDPSEMDPSEFAPSSSLINPSSIPSTTQSAASLAAQRQQHEAAQRAHREQTKRYQCLYPIYFDATRSRADGRRITRSEAVPNPLARTIVDALQTIGLPRGAQVVFEATKTHPCDWANPGRVRVQLRDDGGRDTTGGAVRGKNDLLHKVAAYLRAHPTTEDSPLRFRLPGMPPQQPDEKKAPEVQVPRGWKVGTILPLHSPALSGGGVSEDFFKDMMKEMQASGAGGPGGAGNPLANMANMLGGMGGMGGLGGMGGMGGMPALGGPGQGGKEKKKGKK